MFAGQLVPAKQLPLAISAFRHVAGARLVVIGNGSERQRLNEVIAQQVWTEGS